MVHKEIDPYLDRLYNSNIRCPYCKAKIFKFTTTCPRCGVHKDQIFKASNLKAKQIMKEKTGEKIFLMRRIPNDVSFTRMALLSLLLGFSGAHCFHVGRKIRGWSIAISTVIGFISLFVPESWRSVFTDVVIYRNFTLMFPTDYFMVASIMMWAYDFVSIVFNFFKYPVRLGDAVIAKPKQ